MAGLLLTSEQIRSAPAEVRHWLKAVVEAEFALDVPMEPAEHHPVALAACSQDEAAAVLERIRSDYVSTQVFFELGREPPAVALATGQLYRISLPDVARHCRVRNFEHLAACLETITAAFRDVRRDPEAALFATDQRGGLYVHEVTHTNIAKLWHELVVGEIGRAAGQPAMPAPMQPPAPSAAAE